MQKHYCGSNANMQAAEACGIVFASFETFLLGWAQRFSSPIVDGAALFGFYHIPSFFATLYHTFKSFFLTPTKKLPCWESYFQFPRDIAWPFLSCETRWFLNTKKTESIKKPFSFDFCTWSVKETQVQKTDSTFHNSFFNELMIIDLWIEWGSIQSGTASC